MFGFDTWVWVLLIASTAYSIHGQVEQANKVRAARQDYYNKLQQYNQKQNAFASAKASSKDARLNAQKYSLISDNLAADATRREGESKQVMEKKRPLKQLFNDFGNKWAAGSIAFVKPNNVLLISKSDFNKTPAFLKEPDFLQFNFDVEKFNTNFLGEAKDGNVR